MPVTDNYQTHNVMSESADPESFLSLYRHLSALRNESDALRYGSIDVLKTDNPAVLSFVRHYADETLTTTINFSNKSQKFTQPAGELLISSHPAGKKESSDLKPREARLYKA